MKRFRHYDKETAIVLACFGSVVEQQRYVDLQRQVQAEFSDIPVELAVSSRMVIKRLAVKQQQCKNLPQVLADLDMQGYRKVVVASVYLFPTEEHAQARAAVRGFAEFSLSRMVLTPALLHHTKQSNQILSSLAERFATDDSTANLFISHGAPLLDNPGYSAVQYAEGLLRQLGPHNFTCSLEGAYPFAVVQQQLKAEIKARMPGVARPRVRLIPLLLVSGNHFVNDLADISEALGSEFDVELAKPVVGDKFCMLDLPQVTETLIGQIKDEITKLG